MGWGKIAGKGGLSLLGRQNWKFLAGKSVLKPSKFIAALKMRANVAGDKAALARAKIKEDINCRRYHAQKETLGQCIYTKKARIERRDVIKDYIRQQVIEQDKETAVTREPNLRSPDGDVLKPDLVIKSREGVFVVDVTDRQEDGDYLRLDKRSKIEKYGKLLPDLQDKGGGLAHYGRHQGSYSNGHNPRTAKTADK
jgi:hypothetical protein